MSFDFHMHSVFSDGSSTLEDIFEISKKINQRQSNHNYIIEYLVNIFHLFFHSFKKRAGKLLLNFLVNIN